MWRNGFINETTLSRSVTKSMRLQSEREIYNAGTLRDDSLVPQELAQLPHAVIACVYIGDAAAECEEILTRVVQSERDAVRSRSSLSWAIVLGIRGKLQKRGLFEKLR